MLHHICQASNSPKVVKWLPHTALLTPWAESLKRNAFQSLPKWVLPTCVGTHSWCIHSTKSSNRVSNKFKICLTVIEVKHVLVKFREVPWSSVKLFASYTQQSMDDFGNPPGRSNLWHSQAVCREIDWGPPNVPARASGAYKSCDHQKQALSFFNMQHLVYNSMYLSVYLRLIDVCLLLCACTPEPILLRDLTRHIDIMGRLFWQWTYMPLESGSI